MAEDDSKKSKFSLKKSKWGKIFKEVPVEDSTSGANGQQASFKLNEDVTDFLKPSTEKHVPKIDIAIAKRWPDAHEVRRAEESNSALRGGSTRRTRKEGLTVGFVKTLPEVIGEGGDEALEPPNEVSRNKALVSRSVSERKPGSQDYGAQGIQWPRSPPLPHGSGPPPRFHREDDFVPQPLRRAQTSHNEVSLPMQRKHASPPLGAQEPHLPSLARVPTGFNDMEADIVSPLETPIEKRDTVMDQHRLENERPASRERPKIETSFAAGSQEKPSTAMGHLLGPAGGVVESKPYAGLSPQDAASPVARKRREMSTNEGMAFRRASMLIHKHNDEDDSPPQSGYHKSELEPHEQMSASSSQGTVPPEIFTPDESDVTPETGISASGLNPFADPKYIKRHSRDVAPQVQSLRQTARPQMYTRSSQHSASNQGAERQGNTNVEQPLEAAAAAIHGQRASVDRHVPQMSPPQPRHQRAPSQEQYVEHRDRQPNIAALATPNQERSRSRAGSTREGSFDKDTLAPQNTHPLFARPNGSSSSVNRPGPGHSRSSSRDNTSLPTPQQPASFAFQQQLSPASSRYQNSQFYSQGSTSQDSRSSLPDPRRGPSPADPAGHARRSPEEYFTHSVHGQQVKSSASHLRQEDAGRPGSASSHTSRPSVSPQPPDRGNPAAETAYADFAGRVAHMKGVFRLTAEKELPADRCTSPIWLRTGLWWYLQGKAGLEILLKSRDPRDRREALSQPHVDLAKAWWILSDPLEHYDDLDDAKSQDPHSAEDPEAAVRRAVTTLRTHLQSLSLSMTKNNLLPPTQSLIQGQDTRIWLEYPNFHSDAAAVLGGNTSKSLVLQDSVPAVDPYQMLPLGDTREFFCYGRFAVDVFINTDDADTDRMILPCMLTVMRKRHDYQTTLVIASQSQLVNICISPKQERKGALTWSDVSWKASSLGMTIRLPRNFDLSVRMREDDFRAVWNLSEYARKVEKSLRAEADERPLHEARLAELQYADSANSNSFPTEKVKGCRALVYERHVEHTDGNGRRKLHRGYRLLLITDPGHKTLSSVSHDVCRKSPLYFEYLTDSAANGTTAMVIRVREEQRQCRILLVFPDAGSRQMLYDVLNGLAVGTDEQIVGKMTLTAFNIESTSSPESFSQSAHPALQRLQWQKLGVTNTVSEDPNTRIPKTVHSESLRIVARHTTGCITDRLNLGKGELLLRLPASDTPTVQILRQPQEDLSMSIDTRHSSPQVSDGIGQIMHVALQQPTIRTFSFASQADLHAFETCITGSSVRFDGLASSFGISRRRMVVPIYKKWEASNVRLQIVANGGIVQVLAFMEDFSHADALCFQVKSTDTFENMKGDGKSKRPGVKMVDAKFSLPSKEKGEVNEEDRVRRRFVNLEGLDYAEEHDDITISFETEQERDRFAQALPAATSVSRGITLKRRI